MGTGLMKICATLRRVVSFKEEKDMRLTKVTVSFTWSIGHEVSTYTFGSVEGANDWIKSHRNEIEWCSVEEVRYVPCDATNESGMMYQEMLYHEFIDFRGRV